VVSQQYNSRNHTFDLTITAQFVVPPKGDSGNVTLTLAELDVQHEQQVGGGAQVCMKLLWRLQVLQHSGAADTSVTCLAGHIPHTC
jgi:hypothetical protein